MDPLHRPRLRPRRPHRALRDDAGHARSGEEPHPPAHGKGSAAADRRTQDGLAGGARLRLRRRRGPGLGRRLPGRGHGRRGSRPGRAVPLSGPVRAGTRHGRHGRPRRARAGVRHRHRPGLQRLAGRLLPLRPRPHVGAAMVAPHDIDGAVGEARRGVEELGFKAVFLSPGCVNRRPWHDPAYDPLWAEIQRLDVPVAFHGGGQTYLRPDFSLEVLDTLMLWHTFNQPLGIQMVTASLCGGGVLERFPDLRVALLEGNCSWAPWLLHRLDEHYEWTGWYEAPELTMKPSEYFRRNCFVGVEADEETAVHYLDWFGDDNVVFSTDYPHGDSQYPHAVDTFEKLAIPESSKVRIVGENWERLYKIPLARKT
ncbi:MAG: amidohydrolase family protein [Acidimicrobiales bacterium]